MTTIEVYECDDCGYTSKQDNPNMSVEEEIKQCAVCGQDVCGSCGQDHARDCTGLVWN